MRPIFAALALAFVSACAAIPPLEYGTDDASDSDGSVASDGAAETSANDATADAESDAEVSDAQSADATGDAAACTLSGTTGVAACDSCIATSCCALGNACFANAECLAIVKCVRDCVTNAQPPACRTACRNQHPNGKKVYNDVVACIGSSCKTAPCAS